MLLHSKTKGWILNLSVSLALVVRACEVLGLDSMVPFE